MTDLKGKRILITGGSSGVGACMARHYASLGAEVWIAGRRQDALDRVATTHEFIHAVQADVSREEDVVRLLETSGPCDIVIANAGISMGKPFLKTTLDDWQRQVDVNLTGVYLTMREGLRVMPRSWGRMIVVASVASVKGLPFAAPYTATKHGVVGLVRAVALEMAKTGITVNAICPGYLNTEMTDRNIAAIVERTGKTAEQAAAILTASNPQARMIEASEVSEAALYLMGDAATSVNGHCLILSGGET